ncbi:MarR family winged helix-turn-helix transcriptional regulator [Allofustis seminis]|uniref:MarR family winged helix-turn-helix transcriptional regulator n=1 Tax=Allofustis seminis TaxID=166939 RepID=UPI000361C243|nr:MarR family winged helix-turn-helix transcriptional regulator [Allofustis seminis]
MNFICHINILYRFGKNLLDDMLKDQQLDMQQLITILVVHDVPGIFQSQLNHYLSMDKGNLSKFLKKLEDKKILRRAKSGDKFGHNECYLTEIGEKLVPTLKETLKDWEMLCTRNISPEHLALFGCVSQKVSDNLTQKTNQKLSD